MFVAVAVIVVAAVVADTETVLLLEVETMLNKEPTNK